MNNVTATELTALYITLDAVRNGSSWNWNVFTTPENRNVISRLDAKQLSLFKERMNEVDGGMTHSFVREAYALNPNESPEELYAALSDEDPNVVLFAMGNPNISEEVLNWFITFDESKFDVSPYDTLEGHTEILVECCSHLEAIARKELPYKRKYSTPIYNF